MLPELEREFGLGMTTPSEMVRLLALIGTGKAVSARHRKRCCDAARSSRTAR